MRVRIVRETYPDENREMLVVQKWVPKAPSLQEAWQHVLNFFPHEYDEACEFAMKLSMSKESATQAAVFEDGAEVKSAPTGCDSPPRDFETKLMTLRSTENCATAPVGVNSDQPSPFSSAERPMATGPDA